MYFSGFAWGTPAGDPETSLYELSAIHNKETADQTLHETYYKIQSHAMCTQWQNRTTVVKD